MDELDLLKKDWKKQESKYPTLSFDEIYKMIHKRSSSIVKWIFIICIAEFAFWALLNLLVPDSYIEIYEKFHLKTFLHVSQVIHYIVVAVFLYLFYKNFKSISVIDNTKVLMKKILKTRKTVNYYIYYNIGLYVILTIIFNIVMFSNSEILMELVDPEHTKNVNEALMFNIMLVTQIIVFIIMVALLCLFYRVVYGILLRRLKKNYKELASLEI
ncbi:hypothetical protein SAMN05444411_103166 [Lutibacter oricola]|uniref:Uncharacterized protein n=1 Tax=Lutibacter oricola TaxID=762486 RepID=A0A1H2Z7M4_9FLAO|nr:hypothetical protein [Lutibacter oricola]SDX13326.1 hypothetical protein SAMN05444411_103166 [Lutibacter oricola]